MTIVPTTTLGWTCFSLLGTAVAIVALFATIVAIEKLGGCSLNEAGTGSCRIAGVELVEPLSLLAMLSGISFFLLGPLVLLGAVVTGVACLIRQCW